MRSFAENPELVLKKNSAVDYQMKIDSRSNLTRLMRRFAEADEVFAERFAADLNKHFDHCIGGKMKCFDSYINCQIDEKTAESKVADIDYQDSHFAEAEIVEKVTVMHEVNTDQNYLYCYHFDFNID